MTADEFKAWLSEMKAAKLIRSDADAARALGTHANTILRYKDKGADQQTALACRALFHRMKPWGAPQ